jgi:hypothetical protein
MSIFRHPVAALLAVLATSAVFFFVDFLFRHVTPSM